MADPLIACHPETLVPAVAARLAERYDVVDVDDPRAALARALVTGGAGADAASIERLPALELIALAVVGFDAVDLVAAKARSIVVSNTPDVLTDDVADLAIGLMISTGRRLAAADAFVRAGDWASGARFPLTHRVSGKRLGLIGMGRIGQAIARRAAPMMREILYHTRRPVAGLPWRHVADARELAEQVDILIVIAPATPQTRGMVDAGVIGALGPDGMLINVARGSLVDEPALIAALADGRLGAAGLDVFADEPAVPEALIRSDRVMLLPHIGSATEETRTAMGELVLANLDAHFAGRPLVTPVPLPD